MLTHSLLNISKSIYTFWLLIFIWYREAKDISLVYHNKKLYYNETYIFKTVK